MTDREELIDYGQRQLQRKREQRMADITEGDIEVDPDLLDVGDEVAEEVVSEFKRVKTFQGDMVRLIDSSSFHKRGGAYSPWTEEERTAAAQRAADMMHEGIKPSQALAVVGDDMGVTPETVKRWASQFHIDLPSSYRAARSGEAWTLTKRQNVFDEQMDIVAMLTARMKVWLTPELNQDPNSPKPPPDWNAANELKTIAVAAAIIHDKRTNIEDLMTSRGIRDVDSEELQGELSAGKQRLLEMGSD